EGSDILIMEISAEQTDDAAKPTQLSTTEETTRGNSTVSPTKQDTAVTVAATDQESPQGGQLQSSVQLAAASQPIHVTGVKPHASPSVRRFARELGVDLSKIVGSGTKQRILKEDIQAFVKRE